MDTCASCGLQLTLQIHDEDSEESGHTSGPSSPPRENTVPDDVELACGCHSHWQCLLDNYEGAGCPFCGRKIFSNDTSGASQILCNLTNEGGEQYGLDILPVLNEELYLRAHPRDRKCRAFQEFCREGDVAACVDLLKANDEDEDEDDEEEDGQPQAKLEEHEILRYQDPIGSMHSPLHIAVLNGKVEVIWLLLLLASLLEPDQFPREVLEMGNHFGLKRNEQTGLTDIRNLKDNGGKLALDYVHSGNLVGRFRIEYLDANFRE